MWLMLEVPLRAMGSSLLKSSALLDTVAGMGVSMQEEGLLMASQHSAFFFGNLGYHDIEHMEAGVEGRDILLIDDDEALSELDTIINSPEGDQP